MPDVIPNAYVIPSEGCEGVSDRLHFSAQGYRDLGVRYANQMLSILGYDIEGDESDLIETLSSELENKEMLPGSIQDMNVKATYKNGNIAPVGSLVSAVSSNPDVAYYSRGKIVAKSGGDATITVTYKDFSGTEKTTSQDVTVKSFFAFDLINPSIWTDGTFDQQTQTLVTGQWGAGGWWYDNAIDISDFKYLIVDLSKTQTCGTEFRLFDENSYWTQPASYVFGTSKRVIVDLQSMTKTVDGVKKKCDPSHIYGVCFWSHGGGDIALQDIYLTNSDNYEKPMSVNSVKLNQRDVVDVYNLNGILLYSNLKRKNILKTLSSGIYIIDNEKILIP